MTGVSQKLSWLVLALALLLGQGAALHHQHEIAADCVAGPCAEHGAHVDPTSGAATPTDTVSEADLCPFCELLSQGRTHLRPSTATIALAEPSLLRLASCLRVTASWLDLGAQRPRAPPRFL